MRKSDATKRYLVTPEVTRQASVASIEYILPVVILEC